MVKILFVTYFIALTICLTCAYKQDCSVGPEYWCQSFQNAQDCGALRHCTDTVWRYDEQYSRIDSSTKCEWCEKVLENTHRAIQNVAHNKDLIESTLLNGCKLLPFEDISSKCTTVIENYQTTVLSLLEHRRYDRLCRLMEICPSERKEYEEQIPIDQQSKMLCNVIVRATHDLHVNQGKSRDEIASFLKNDCEQLDNSRLVEKCEDLVERHGNEIYAHVASNVELSKVCDYLDSSALESVQNLPCELCTFVISNAKKMLDDRQTEDKVLFYIDEQVCSRLNGKSKRDCKQLIDTNGRDLIKKIQDGRQPLLLCTHFQMCLEDIVDKTSPIEKDEMHSFLRENLCEKLGSLKSACEALIEKDGTRLLQVLANEINGNELCHMFGLCPKKSSILDGLALKDDPSKCKRCVADFTRRKHIAEKLVNHSSEFLHHLCRQLPQKDDCTKAIEDSINELTTFIRSLNPQEICVQLNMCDQKLRETIQIDQSESVISEEIIEYIKSDVCTKLGSLSSLCAHLAETEGLNLLKLVSKDLDPHRVCEIVDVCPSNIVYKACKDKCQCCRNRVEIYQNQLAKFMRTIVASTRIMCDHVPGRDMCLRLADIFESNVQKVVAQFDSKHTCELLHLCTPMEEKKDKDQCRTCKSELDIRQSRFRTTINELTTDLRSLCKDTRCRLQVQSTQQEILNKINNINSQNICQRLGYCLTEDPIEPSLTSLRLRSLVQHQTKTLEERLEAHDICSEYGQYKSICEHLMISVRSERYAHVYLALLQNNPRLIDDDLREQMATNVGADVCGLCKNVVQTSKDFWTNALESVLSVLLRTCERCPSKAECLDYFNTRFDTMKSYLDNIDPNQFCQNIHLCSTSNVILSTKPKAQSLELSDSNSTCIFCEYMMNMLSSYIHQHSTEDEIEQSLQKVCTQMPATLRTQCHQLVDNYGPAIIATLINDFDVSTICHKLNLCTNQMKVELSHLEKANVALCGVCDYVSTYVGFALKRDSSDKSLQHALSTVCTHLSNEQRSPCQTIVQLITPNIRTVKLEFGNNFCKELTICQTPMSELKPAIHLNHLPSKQDDKLRQEIVQNLDETPQCMLCHYVVSYLDAILKNNKSEEEFQEALKRVCTILPRKERTQCAEFVKNYGPVLADLISELADPRMVCRYLGMCQVISSEERKPITYSNHRYARIPV